MNTAKKKQGNLRKELGVLDVFCISSGAMISSGLFILPGLVYAMTGSAAFIVYLLASTLVIPALCCKIELSTAMPKAGGTYFYIERSLGSAFGTLGGIASWFSLSLKSAFALFGIGAFGLLFNSDFSIWGIRAVAVIVCLFVTLFNIHSVKHAARLQVWLVLLLLAGLFLYCLQGVRHINTSYFNSFEDCGWRNIWAATGLVFVAYGGLTKVDGVAEEVKNPGRVLPIGMFAAFGIVTIFYVVTVLITIGLLGSSMSGNLNPLIHGASVSFGKIGLIIIGFSALLAYTSTANAGLMSSSRIPLAMSRDQLLPESFSEISSSHHTPVAAIWFTSAFMITAILTLDFETLVKVASTMKIILFLLVCLAVILMRESRIENYRPEYKVPLYPYLPIIGIIAYSFLVFEMGRLPLLLTATFFGTGLLWYGFYGRIRVNRESALIRITKRIMPSTFVSDTLESELRDILIARDGIVADRFDQIVHNCPILDFKEQLSAEELFSIAAKNLTHRIDIASDEITRLLTKREQTSSTVITPGLAIPHIIVPGNDEFHVLMARSKAGFIFGDNKEPVHAVFILAGSEDARNYHLRVLMYIAQIAQDPHFEKRWLVARDINSLRNLVLLAKRTRETIYK